ncbi:MAG: VWA domain-containing protein [Desulfobacteraceae bacterium]|nr:VWA domain-containing protein [Desulfobacteraceae bacterium]
MINKNTLLVPVAVLFIMLPVLFMGCAGGGGGDDSSDLSPSIQVSPLSYEFGEVTPGNTPVPLDVVIANNGNAELHVEDIRLTQSGETSSGPFSLELSGGAGYCGSRSSYIAAGDKCIVQVAFEPGSVPASFDETLTIASDDPHTPILDVMLSGSMAQISDLSVRINQIEALNCPLAVGGEVEVYVSVIDQAGYPVTGLGKADFSIIEGSLDATVQGASYVSEGGYVPISVALVMDYSGSITNIEDAVQDMEDSVKSFIDQMKEDDESEIIKFADVPVNVTGGFISDKESLKAAVGEPWDGGRNTSLYDAVYMAIGHTDDRTNVRKAVIVITDGKNTESSESIDAVIALGKEKNIPVFAAGLGDDVNTADLADMAEQTGGQYYEADISDNLKNTYQQLADVIYDKQYILTYKTGLGGVNIIPSLTIEATKTQELTGSHTKADIPVCP